MKKILITAIIALTLFSSAPRPAHAGGADLLTFVAAQLFGGAVRVAIGVGEFVVGAFLPDPKPKTNPVAEVSAAEGKGAEGNPVTAPAAAVEGAGSPAVNTTLE
ncbi:hypothetical protein RW64_17355 [Geobacter sulfurreducens]|nr:hypothetical protein RW64_17355 [Geobacter sulfurreducens]